MKKTLLSLVAIVAMACASAQDSTAVNNLRREVAVRLEPAMQAAGVTKLVAGPGAHSGTGHRPNVTQRPGNGNGNSAGNGTAQNGNRKATGPMAIGQQQVGDDGRTYVLAVDSAMRVVGEILTDANGNCWMVGSDGKYYPTTCPQAAPQGLTQQGPGLAQQGQVPAQAGQAPAGTYVVYRPGDHVIAGGKEFIVDSNGLLVDISGGAAGSGSGTQGTFMDMDDPANAVRIMDTAEGQKTFYNQNSPWVQKEEFAAVPVPRNARGVVTDGRGRIVETQPERATTNRWINNGYNEDGNPTAATLAKMQRQGWVWGGGWTGGVAFSGEPIWNCPTGQCGNGNGRFVPSTCPPDGRNAWWETACK